MENANTGGTAIQLMSGSNVAYLVLYWLRKLNPTGIGEVFTHMILFAIGTI